jgi:hypothetical protein
MPSKSETSLTEAQRAIADRIAAETSLPVGTVGFTGSFSPPAQEPMLQFFAYAHLPPHLQGISEPFCTLASLIVETLPRNPERTVALRKLLEAKDCAVRAVLYK